MSKLNTFYDKEVIIYQLRDSFGEEMVVAAMGVRRRSSILEMEMSQDFPIGQRLQQQRLAELFFYFVRSESYREQKRLQN